MSPEPLPEIVVSVQDFAQIWAEATARVLETLHGKPFTATPRPPVAAETSVAASGESFWTRFRVSGRLAGELAFQFTRSDGVRLGQLASGQPLDGAAAFNETHTSALREVFRQFAGVASVACEAKYAGAIQFEYERGAEPDWKPAGYAAWIFAAPEIAPLQWTLLLDSGLCGSLESSREKPELAAKEEVQTESSEPIAALPPPPAEPSTASSKPEEQAEQPAHDPPPEPTYQAPAEAVEGAAPNPANLDLLLDVELDASLRFGKRDMLLREVLELRPGSVVELDEKLQEPAELMIAGRVIARGEVVIVDGSYGLRITDVVQPKQRLESVET
jgi:flagellar motor switch protein FliN